MFRKISAVLLCLAMLFSLVACAPDKDPSEPSVSDDTQQQDLSLNPLTGLSDVAEGKQNLRPVAIMVGNASDAQPVQTGLDKADIIYETEVEGGVTRLLAVYQDFAAVGKIGSIRSARYPYVDLALGHNAIYLHAGQDPTYCKPHLADIDDISIETNYSGVSRLNNGLPSWNHLYVEDSNALWESIKGTFSNDNSGAKSWVNFATEDEKITLSSGSASTVMVPFPANKARFTYSADTGLYTRFVGSAAHKDYYTQAATEVKNIFVLLTNISNYPDGKHRKVDLESGEGYYITNGTYQFINWSKGSQNNGFKFTDSDGNEIKVNAGSSWVCIADKHTSNPEIK